MSTRRLVLLASVLALGAVFAFPMHARTLELGANFNEHLGAARDRELAAAQVKWIRGFLPAFEFIDGRRSLATDPALANFRAAAVPDRCVALTLKWDFKRSQTRVPAPGSDRERACFAWAVDVVKHGRPDLLLLINELFVDTPEADTVPGPDGAIPIVSFLQRLAAHMAAAGLRTPAGAPLPLSCGGFTRINTAAMQQQPATRALLPWLAASTHLSHVNFHMHQNSLDEFASALAFMRDRVPSKPLVVTEFSLVWAYKPHLDDKLAIDAAGRAFAEKHYLDPDLTVREYLNYCLEQPVAEVEWNAFLHSRAWFDPQFLDRACALMERNGVVLATYAFVQEASGARSPLGAGATPWRLNPIFAERHAISPDPARPAVTREFYDAFVARQR